MVDTLPQVSPDCLIEFRKMLNDRYYSFLNLKINY
jgi:hypothetical protein